MSRYHKGIVNGLTCTTTISFRNGDGIPAIYHTDVVLVMRYLICCRLRSDYDLRISHSKVGASIGCYT